MAATSQTIHGGLALQTLELTQQPLRFLLRQPASNHRLRYLLGGLAIKLVAYGESAFVQPGKGSTHAGVNGGSAEFDDDRDLIVVAVTKSVEGHG
jgi:hypothetical protein